MKNRKKAKQSKVDLFIHLIVKVRKDDVFALASQLAYYLVLSFFPFLIFLITLIGFSKLNANDILFGLSKFLPETVYQMVENIVVEVVNSQNTGMLGASIVLTVWAASSSFRAVIKGVNKAYEIEDRRSFIKRSIIAVFCTIALALAIIGALAMLVFGNLIGKYLLTIIPFNHIINILWNLFRYLFIVSMMVLIFAAIYKFIPSKKLKWRDVFPGAIITTLGWVLASVLFGYYVNNFANYSMLYGSLGAVFLLMTWLFINSLIFIFGVEVNSVLQKNKERKELE